MPRVSLRYAIEKMPKNWKEEAIEKMTIKKKVRNWLTAGGCLLLLALVWAAADDITTGNEPDYRGEHLVLVMGAGAAGFGLGRMIKRG